MVFHTSQSKKYITPYIPDLEIGGTKLERVVDFNFLGLTLNENMSWKSHTDKLANKLSKYVGIINRLKRYLPSHILKTLYFSLVHSSLNYALLAWGFNCGRLKKLQKKIIRIITNSKFNAHTEPILKEVGILKLEDMFKLNICKWYYRYKHRKLPYYFLDYVILPQSQVHNHNTRINRNITQPKTRIQAVRYILRNHVSIVINAIPEGVLSKIQTHSFKGFANYAKKYILSQYSRECRIERCYVCSPPS